MTPVVGDPKGVKAGIERDRRRGYITDGEAYRLKAHVDANSENPPSSSVTTADPHPTIAQPELLDDRAEGESRLEQRKRDEGGWAEAPYPDVDPGPEPKKPRKPKKTVGQAKREAAKASKPVTRKAPAKGKAKPKTKPAAEKAPAKQPKAKARETVAKAKETVKALDTKKKARKS